MKKRILIASFLFIILIIMIILTIKKNHRTVESNESISNDCTISIEDNSFNYNDDIYLKDIVNQECNLISNEKLNTRTLGKNNYTIKYKNTRGKNSTLKYTYNIVDNVNPLVLISSSYTVYNGSNTDLVNKAICADNYDKKPNCYIEGVYDINKNGTYKLKYIAIDSSNNKTIKDFTLYVKDKPKNNNTNNNSTKQKLKMEDAIKTYKKDNNMIGIDISAWQDQIDFKKVKEAGVEFVIIRIGFGHKNNELILDKRFKEYISGAKEANLKIGLYFYSYAKNTKESIEQAKWIINELNGEKLDLPIAFDWEDWSKFNSYNVSLTDINDIAESFIKEINDNGYTGMIYSSKYYLENIWNLNKYPTWLAHYTKQTNYDREYLLWQFSNQGKVNGINTDVDLDILYTN